MKITTRKPTLVDLIRRKLSTKNYSILLVGISTTRGVPFVDDDLNLLPFSNYSQRITKERISGIHF